jgi:hypothetical protein
MFRTRRTKGLHAVARLGGKTKKEWAETSLLQEMRIVGVEMKNFLKAIGITCLALLALALFGFFILTQIGQP